MSRAARAARGASPTPMAARPAPALRTSRRDVENSRGMGFLLSTGRGAGVYVQQSKHRSRASRGVWRRPLRFTSPRRGEVDNLRACSQIGGGGGRAPPPPPPPPRGGGRVNVFWLGGGGGGGGWPPRRFSGKCGNPLTP